METWLHFRLISGTFQRTESRLPAARETGQDPEAGPLTWVPEDQAGKKRHVKFSLHFPLNNCSCFALGGKILPDKRSKDQGRKCAFMGGKVSDEHFLLLNCLGKFYTSVLLSVSLERRDYDYLSFFLCRKKNSSLQEWNKTSKFSPQSIPLAPLNLKREEKNCNLR